MLFRRKHRPDLSLTPATDPVIDAQIHWLANRGLVVREGMGKEEWIAAAEDPTDPISLAEAAVDGVPCCQPDPMITVDGTDLVQMVHALADGLELPIDDVESAGAELTIRSATAHFSFVAEGRDPRAVLSDIAGEFVDPAHVLLVKGSSFAIVHRDISEQAQTLMDINPNART